MLLMIQICMSGRSAREHCEASVGTVRITKSAQAGVDANPNSARVPELKQVGTILSGHHAAG
jgi:hypothetical protein